MFTEYKYGKETVPVYGVSTSDGSSIIVGSIRDDRYRIMLVKIDGHGKVAWKRFYDGENDWEGHYIIPVKGGYIVSGAVEGLASNTGGCKWKGYLLKVNESGERLWEQKYRILGNECVYSVLSVEDGFMLQGIAQGERTAPFLIRTDKEGNMLWTKFYGEGDTALGIIYSDENFLIGISDWSRNRARVIRVTYDGKTVKTVTFENVLLINMFKFEHEQFVIGEKNGTVYLAKISKEGRSIWEHTYGPGTGIAMVKMGTEYFIAGESEEAPFIYQIDKSGKLIRKLTSGLWDKGWVETLVATDDKLLAAGPVRSENDISMGILMIS
ncbi:MAG: hypothetical protein GXO25_03935 [Euryarchaeota archaeon]|nr:hypothetical protein [Euryarchaeota archaeon]